MLKTLKIERFKTIQEQEIEFGKVNLFIGQNGAGKSNILEAIGFLSAALSRGVTDTDLIERGIRLSTPAMFKSAFKNKKLPATLRIEAALDDEVKYGFSLKASELETHLRFASEKASVGSVSCFGRSGVGTTLMKRSLKNWNPDPRRGLWDQLRVAENFPPQLAEQADLIGQYAIYSPQTEFLRGTQVGAVANPPIGLHGEGLPLAASTLIDHWRELSQSNDAAAKLFDRAFQLVWKTGWARRFGSGFIEPKYKSSQIKTGDNTLFFEDKFMNARRNLVTAYDSSEGILFLLFIVILITHPDAPKIFSLDNVDNALNPSMTNEAVSRIIEFTLSEDSVIGPKQVFMTSHNPTALDAFDLFDTSQRVFVVRRTQEGFTEFERLKPPDGISKPDWIELKAGRTLSELWIEGEIAGALGS